MSDFDFAVLLYMIDNHGRSELHHFFLELNRKIALQRRHAETTTELYRREYKEHLTSLKEKRALASVEAKIIFDQVYAETEGSEEDKHFQATMSADAHGIENHYNQEEILLEINYKEMADHFNKSSFVIIYALLENELRKLCDLLKVHFTKRLSLQDIESKDYLQSMVNYLDKVIEIDLCSCQSYLTRIRHVQLLRNKIMHNGGEFPLETPEHVRQLVAQSKGNLLLQHYDPMPYRLLKISKLEYVFEQYGLLSDFIHELMWCIEMRTGYHMLTERLTFLFRFLANGIEAQILEVKQVKKGRTITFLIKKDSEFLLRGTLSLLSGRTQRIELINNMAGNDKLSRLLAYLTDNEDTLLNDILQPFFKSRNALHVRIECDPH